MAGLRPRIRDDGDRVDRSSLEEGSHLERGAALVGDLPVGGVAPARSRRNDAAPERVVRCAPLCADGFARGPAGTAGGG